MRDLPADDFGGPETTMKVELEMGAEAAYKLFSAYTNAGFTDEQAFELVKIQTAAAVTRPSFFG